MFSKKERKEKPKKGEIRDFIINVIFGLIFVTGIVIIFEFSAGNPELQTLGSIMAVVGAIPTGYFMYRNAQKYMASG